MVKTGIALIFSLPAAAGLLPSAPVYGAAGIELHERAVYADAEIAGFRLSNPQAVETDDAGNIYIVDTGNNRIIKLGQDDKKAVVVGGFGWEKEQFDRPLDASIKRGLDLYVADYNNERIERYDRQLNYISSYTNDDRQPESLRFGFPVGIDVSRHGELFICETDNNRILKIDAFGKPSLSFGDFNAGEGQLEDPARVEVSGKDNIYVSDHGSNQLFVYDYYGNFVVRFGQNLLKKPGGLQWYGEDYLFVADTGNRRVVAFDRRLAYVKAWGGDKITPAGFRDPVDVTVWNQTLFVLDSELARIFVFDIVIKHDQTGRR